MAERTVNGHYSINNSERTTMLRILGKASSINVRKVLWTCAELNLPFVREDWGSGFQSTHDPAFLAMNPNAMVPVLVDGGAVLWESNTICRYLAGRYGGGAPLLPADPLARARVEQWMDWQATELNNAWRYAFMALVRNSPAHADPAQVENGIAQWNRSMGILEGQLGKTGAFAAGADFTLADVVLGLSVNRWLMTPMERPDYPAVRAYVERLRERPGCREFCMNGTP
jgi:glutathione S-transferase